MVDATSNQRLKELLKTGKDEVNQVSLTMLLVSSCLNEKTCQVPHLNVQQKLKILDVINQVVAAANSLNFRWEQMTYEINRVGLGHAFTEVDEACNGNSPQREQQRENGTTSTIQEAAVAAAAAAPKKTKRVRASNGNGGPDKKKPRKKAATTKANDKTSQVAAGTSPPPVEIAVVGESVIDRIVKDAIKASGVDPTLTEVLEEGWVPVAGGGWSYECVTPEGQDNEIIEQFHECGDGTIVR